MLLKIKNLKYITNARIVFALLFLVAFSVQAQEIIEDESSVDANTKVQEKAQDSTNGFKPVKVDGVAGVVGDYIVLNSDIDKEFLQLQASGVDTKNITRCQLFGKLLENKLYAHHAIQDSILVSDAEVRNNVDYQLQQFLGQVNGDMNRLLRIYNKENEESLREEMFTTNKDMMLAQRMQAKVIEEVEITPEEVRQFFNKIPKEERPSFGTELKVAQIVVEPKVSDAEKQRIINQLNQFKADVEENGASFRSKVILYGQDPGIKQSGYKYTLNRNKPRMVKEFREAAFSLQEGEVSEPFETDFGFHIVYVEKIRGQEYDVSHVLLMPEVSDEAKLEAKEKLEKVRQQILDGEITFAEAAKEISDDEVTKFDGGQLINPETQDYNFELTRMDPELYAQIQDLKDGEVSPVLGETDRSNKLKFKILTVSDRVEDHDADYATDFLKIKELALNEKKIKAIEDWQEEKIDDTYIKITGSMRDCEFSSNWLKK
ncbi:periplasmic chaperone for outer membrane proteins SurA [Hyunsoonleella jejuensis]|uniref:Periplasmic chaperone for outer membrane proteins SurA n=1 Tax=Hyunsoonleella jejuensis TaxID=419940 RepID=A0A1H9J2U8_9FLAO|nr:periplasmic chaperone for outer membrane proteins SurA [Hyunsoonleella jejuensis]